MRGGPGIFKLRNEARILQRKALSSLRRAMTAFNSPDDDGRVTNVLISFQHAFEMLLKGALVQSRVQVFDRRSGRSHSFEQCIRLAQQAARIKLTDEEAGTLRAIDAMRDDEQHWFNTVEEGLLYLHSRAAVTLFDDILARAFNDRLANHLPVRVLPVGTAVPQDFLTLIDREYSNIAELLKPGRRARADAQSRIRALLALEAHTDPDTRVSEADVNRIERAVREGKARGQVFPKLDNVAASFVGQGQQVQVRFVKKGGMPVRLVKDGEVMEEVDVGAVREVDLQKKYHRGPHDLADSLGLTRPRSNALREHLGIDADERFLHVFDFGAQRHPRYSDNAFTVMRDAIENGLDMESVWSSHRPRRSGLLNTTTAVRCRRRVGAGGSVLGPGWFVARWTSV
jgi:hypothetical protein